MCGFIFYDNTNGPDLVEIQIQKTVKEKEDTFTGKQSNK